jgi:[ribosomal protein S18]-alanine N-acetyltransferase
VIVYNIRRVQPEDIFPVSNLAYTELPERYHPSIFSQFYESFPEGFLVAEHNQTIIGFLIGIKTTRTTARILMLAVDQHYRKKNLGSTLVKQFLDDMRQAHVTKVDLEVRMANQGTIEFYKKQGFVLKDALRHFYQNGEDAYSMSREL